MDTSSRIISIILAASMVMPTSSSPALAGWGFNHAARIFVEQAFAGRAVAAFHPGGIFSSAEAHFFHSLLPVGHPAPALRNGGHKIVPVISAVRPIIADAEMSLLTDIHQNVRIQMIWP